MSDTIDFRFLKPSDLELIFTYVRQLNHYTDEHILKRRLQQMFSENYRCLGIYISEECKGICGMWQQTRHYSGYSLEVDHVVIDPLLRSMGIGASLFYFLETWAKTHDFEAIELNTYVHNTKSHRFYEKLGFDFRGRHYVKEL